MILLTRTQIRIHITSPSIVQISIIDDNIIHMKYLLPKFARDGLDKRERVQRGLEPGFRIRDFSKSRIRGSVPQTERYFQTSKK